MVKKVAKKNGDLISTLRHLQDIVMRILKTCSECGKSFVASKMTNKYCSRQCANVVKRRNESIRKGKLKEESKSEEQNVKIQELYLKPFLTPKEVSVLLGVCLTTVYRYFYSGTIKAVRIRQRTFIRREDLDKFFEDSSSYRKRNNQKADKNEYYTLREIMEKYKIGRKAVWGRCDRLGIPKVYIGRNTFFNKIAVDSKFGGFSLTLCHETQIIKSNYDKKV